MKKLLSLLGVGVLVAMWSGCVNNPVTAPRVSIDAIGTIAIGTNDVVKHITGKIEADTAIASITATVETSAGVAVPTTQISVTTPAGTTEKTMTLTDNSGFNLTIKSAAQPGNYKLKITVDAGAATTVSFDFTLTGNPGTTVTTADVTIGSYNSTTGSSIDLDNGTVLTAIDAIKAGSGVDIVGTYSAKAGSAGFRLFNPVYASGPAGTGSGIDAFQNWSGPAATSFHKVTVDIATITTVEQIAPLYVAASAVDFLICNVNDVLVVKTSENKYALVKVVSYDADVAGLAVIKYAK
jgi:hypothetical protein